MQQIVPRKVKIVSKPSLAITMSALELGVPTLFSTRDFKCSVARVKAIELKKKGYLFTVSENGMVGEFLVTCIKKPIK